MKRWVLQILRLSVTVVVVGTLAAMVFSLREELAKARAQSALAVIRDRTSIRAFDASRPVSAADEETLLRAAMAAPSARNCQPWAFVVVRDEAKLRALAEALPYSRVGNGARMAVVVCGKLDNGLPGRGKEYWIQDCSAATQNLLLAAQALGLGAVWTGVYPGEDRVAVVRRVVDLPDAYMPLNVIPVGYPAEHPAPKDKWNAASVHRNAW